MAILHTLQDIKLGWTPLCDTYGLSINLIRKMRSYFFNRSFAADLMASQIVLIDFHIFFFKSWVLPGPFFGTVEHLPHQICVNVKLSIY